MSKSDLVKIRRLYEECRFEDCIFLCEERLEENFGNYNFLSYYAFCLIKCKRLEKAINILSELIKRERHFHIFKFRGDVYYDLRNYKLAIKDYRESLELDPDNGACWDCLARSYFHIGNFKKAHESIDKAIQISECENEDTPIVIKALFLKFEGKVDEAFELFLEIRKKFKDTKFLSKEMRPLFNLLSDSFFEKYKNKNADIEKNL